MTKLSDRQRRFAQEYVVDLNAKQAAIRAGYSPNGAKVTGSRLLTHTNLAAYIEELKEVIAERTMVTAERVRLELARHAFTNMRDFVEWGPDGVKLKSCEELSEDDAAAVTEVSESFGENGRTLKFKLGQKDSALKTLAQHTGLIDAKGGGGVNVQVNVGTGEEKPDFSNLTLEEHREYVRYLGKLKSAGDGGGSQERALPSRN